MICELLSASRFNKAPQASTGQRQLLVSQVLENKLFLQLPFIRLGRGGSPGFTLCSFVFVFNNLAFKRGEALCLFEAATATVLTTVAWSGSLKSCQRPVSAWATPCNCDRWSSAQGRDVFAGAGPPPPPPPAAGPRARPPERGCSF